MRDGFPARGVGDGNRESGKKVKRGKPGVGGNEITTKKSRPQGGRAQGRVNRESVLQNLGRGALEPQRRTGDF